MKGWKVSLGAVTTFSFLTLAAAGCAAVGATGGRGPDQVPVVLDGTTLVNLTDLTLIPAGDLEEIRVLNGLEATTYFGTNSVAGAVLITTRR